MAKILYIEDIQDNITLVEKIVKSRGHEFQFARNAEEGLALAFASKPDLILLDLGLPDADGQTLSVWLRGDPSLSSIPIIPTLIGFLYLIPVSSFLSLVGILPLFGFLRCFGGVRSFYDNPGQLWVLLDNLLKNG